MISVTVEPELYLKAKERNINLSSLMDAAIEWELSKESKDAPPKRIDITDVQDRLAAKKPAPKAAYTCDFCGSRVEGQYSIMHGKAYCSTCNRVVA